LQAFWHGIGRPADAGHQLAVIGQVEGDVMGEETDLGRSAGGAVVGHWVRGVKQRLRKASAAGLAQGEQLYVVTYAQHGDPPAIIWWESAILAIWFVVMFLPFAASFENVLLIGWFCAAALWIAHAFISLRWLGVVLTDRRLIVFRLARVTQQLQGVLLDVPRQQVSLEFRPYRPSIIGVRVFLRFDDSLGQAPIKLIFGSATMDDAKPLRAGLTGPAVDGPTA
jgi:hypothetical protein